MTNQAQIDELLTEENFTDWLETQDLRRLYNSASPTSCFLYQYLTDADVPVHSVWYEDVRAINDVDDYENFDIPRWAYRFQMNIDEDGNDYQSVQSALDRMEWLREQG